MVWRTLSAATTLSCLPTALKVEVEAGRPLRLDRDVGRPHRVRLEVIRPRRFYDVHGGRAAATSMIELGKTPRRMLAWWDYPEFSRGHGDADLNGIRASLTSLTARHTSVTGARGRVGFRDFFRYEYARDARDAPTLGRPSWKTTGPGAFAWRSRRAAPRRRRRGKELLHLRASVTYDYDSRSPIEA